MSGAVHTEDEAKKAEEYLLGKAFQVRDIFHLRDVSDACNCNYSVGCISHSPNSSSPLFIQPHLWYLPCFITNVLH